MRKQWTKWNNIGKEKSINEPNKEDMKKVRAINVIKYCKKNTKYNQILQEKHKIAKKLGLFKQNYIKMYTLIQEITGGWYCEGCY